MSYHIPVLLEEVIKLLDPKEGKVIIDGTLGGGGHAKALIEAGAKIIGIDQDPQSLTHVGTRVDMDQSKLTMIEGNFGNLEDLARQNMIEPVDGIFLDLGVSNHQLDSAERGFSFQGNAPLDMRMAPHLTVTAADLVNALGKKELYELFTKYSQERHARKIADAIVRSRRMSPIRTTWQLGQIVEHVYKYKKGHLHPATKVFQALRIAVNDELNTLEKVLPQAIRLLKNDGILAIISFHEGEDRLVKNFFRSLSQDRWQDLTRKPIMTSPSEVRANRRSRSAKLRGIKRIKD